MLPFGRRFSGYGMFEMVGKNKSGHISQVIRVDGYIRYRECHALRIFMPCFRRIKEAFAKRFRSSPPVLDSGAVGYEPVYLENFPDTILLDICHLIDAADQRSAVYLSTLGGKDATENIPSTLGGLSIRIECDKSGSRRKLV
jgi:hypothetical protein